LQTSYVTLACGPVSQNSPGRFEVPNWDQASRRKVHDALLVLGETIDTRRMFGTKDQVDPVRHLIGTAIGWGGLPEKDAFYVAFTPGKNDGTTIHRLNVKDVPVVGQRLQCRWLFSAERIQCVFTQQYHRK
jgi:hypothetical protein